jgi:dipeptidyl aminopeptidase/acylaminoacyl peptidase
MGGMFRFCLLFGLVLLVGCRPTPRSRPLIAIEKLPALPKLASIEPGIEFAEVKLPRTDERKSKLYVYLPEKRPAGKLPCVLVAAAGGTLFTGTTLGEGSRPEHLPYVREGFAVIAYEQDGDIAENPSNREVIRGAQDFLDADFGMRNTTIAYNYAIHRLNIDPKRIYTAGHSSAATMALNAAARGSFKACIAYAPCVDINSRVGEVLPLINRKIPGFRQALLTYSSPDSPMQRKNLKCPVLLFHARDDSNLPFELTEQYAKTLRKTNPNVTFVGADSGDHYDSMIEQGIPAGIRWLKEIDKKASK